MSRVALVHWNKAEAEERAQRLRNAGRIVETIYDEAGKGARDVRGNPPDVFVIDLSRACMRCPNRKS